MSNFIILKEKYDNAKLGVCDLSNLIENGFLFQYDSIDNIYKVQYIDERLKENKLQSFFLNKVLKKKEKVKTAIIDKYVFSYFNEFSPKSVFVYLYFTQYKFLNLLDALEYYKASGFPDFFPIIEMDDSFFGVCINKESSSYKNVYHIDLDLEFEKSDQEIIGNPLFSFFDIEELLNLLLDLSIISKKFNHCNAKTIDKDCFTPLFAKYKKFDDYFKMFINI